MKLTWIGHASFRMEADNGTTVITDPYDDSVGIVQPPLQADLITMSHEHHDHNCEDMIVGDPHILHGLEGDTVGGVHTWAVGSYHDGVEGSMRGSNMIRIFEIDGLKVVHMGDQGCMPTNEIYDAIADADVMMIPVGGFYTIDAAQAKEIIETAKPRCVVPMHVKTQHCGYPIAPVWPFMELMGSRDAQPVTCLHVSSGDAARGVVLMQPLTDVL